MSGNCFPLQIHPTGPCCFPGPWMGFSCRETARADFDNSWSQDHEICSTSNFNYGEINVTYYTFNLSLYSSISDLRLNVLYEMRVQNANFSMRVFSYISLLQFRNKSTSCTYLVPPFKYLDKFT